MMGNVWLLSYITIKKNRKASFTYTPPETTPECCLISGRRRWCFSDEGTPGLLQSDKLLWRLACDRGAYSWSLQGEKHSLKLHWTDFNTNFSGGKKWVDLTCLCLCAFPPEQCWGCPGGLTAGQNKAGGCWCPPKRRCKDAAESATCWPPGEIRRSSGKHLPTADVSPWCLGQRTAELGKQGKFKLRYAENRSVLKRNKQRVSRWLTCAVTLKIPLNTHLLFRLSISALTLPFVRPTLFT